MIADSSIEAMPQTMSPSPGTSCPAVTTTVSYNPRSDEGSSSSSADAAEGSCAASYPTTRCATVLVRVARRLSACALPRPSATDSARFAKSTVSHSQRAIPHAKDAGISAPPEGAGPPRKGSAIASAVTRTAPISTRNMTGFRHMTLGLSFVNVPGSASTTAFQVKTLRCRGFDEAPVVGSSVVFGSSVRVDMV